MAITVYILIIVLCSYSLPTNLPHTPTLLIDHWYKYIYSVQYVLSLCPADDRKHADIFLSPLPSPFPLALFFCHSNLLFHIIYMGACMP